MTDKELKNSNQDQNLSNSKKKKEMDGKLWSFCPVCGKTIPKSQMLKFCIHCGVDLDYIKKYKQLNPNPNIQENEYPQPHITSDFYKLNKISDVNILNTKNHELWGTMPSVGISLGAFLLMELITTGVLLVMIFFSFNLEVLMDFLSNPTFIIFSTFFELIFILVPVLYVGKYLTNPSLKNRLGLLGFTLKGFTKKGLIKEIFLGLSLAFAGYLLVYGISFLTEITLEFFFGVEIISDLNSATGEFGINIPEGDIASLIVFSLVMILIVGTSEEILFRGFMQKGLMRSLGNLGGIMITAFIFAMIHVLGIVLLFLEESLIHILISFLLSFPPYLIVSLFLGLIYYWRNENLIAVIIAHGVYNALTIILLYFFSYAF
ncbi:MAG: CPBP family intramembrane glutamic endopeptidase [Candidatus Hermodarchaeota archaeon]